MAHVILSVESVRRTKLSGILRALHEEGPRSRSQLGARLAMTRSMIADLVADLSARGLVREETPDHSGMPGRPSPMVQLITDSIAVLAAEIAVDSLSVALVGLGGQVRCVARIPHSPGRLSADETVSDLARLADEVLARAPRGCFVAGVGVAFYGVVRRSDGFVHLAHNLGWRDVPLGLLLQQSLGSSAHARVTVANDADLGALAEHTRGAGRGADDMIYLASEVGIGGGVIANGIPLGGAAGVAGEVGHLPVNSNGMRCYCGATGCWETEAAETALLRHAGREFRPPCHDCVAEVLADAARGDLTARAAVETIGHWLGVGLAILVNIFNPERVVLGGFFGEIYPSVATIVREQVLARAFQPARDLVNIVPATLGADTALLGAAELAFEPILADPTTMPVRKAASAARWEPDALSAPASRSW
jgi:predicted NBD/HSP70 family sugar kinase